MDSRQTEREKVMRAKGQVVAPLWMMVGLSMALSYGFKSMGIHTMIHGWLVEVCSRGGRESYGHVLPVWVPWVAALMFASGGAYAMMESVGMWRRLVIFLSLMGLIIAWAPVLSLASYLPQIAPAFVAAGWSCFCALVYCANHQMPCEIDNNGGDQ